MLAEMKRLEAAARVSMVSFAEPAPRSRSLSAGLRFAWKPAVAVLLGVSILMLAWMAS